MAKFRVTLDKIIQCDVIVEANDKTEATKQVNDLWYKNKIELKNFVVKNGLNVYDPIKITDTLEYDDRKPGVYKTKEVKDNE